MYIYIYIYIYTHLLGLPLGRPGAGVHDGDVRQAVGPQAQPAPLGLLGRGPAPRETPELRQLRPQLLLRLLQAPERRRETLLGARRALQGGAEVRQPCAQQLLFVMLVDIVCIYVCCLSAPFGERKELINKQKYGQFS